MRLGQQKTFNKFFELIAVSSSVDRQCMLCKYFLVHRLLKQSLCVENYTVREVLMKNYTRVWRIVYNTASPKHELYYKYFAKHKCDFSLILRRQV